MAASAAKWPTNAWVVMQWGRCADRLGRPEEARQVLERAVHLAPDSKPVRQAYDQAMRLGPFGRLLRKLKKD